VARVADGLATLRGGGTEPYDVALLAMGVRPSPIFTDSGPRVGPAGGLLVNDYLRSIAHADIFGEGDCISLEDHRLARVGAHAVR